METLGRMHQNDDESLLKCYQLCLIRWQKVKKGSGPGSVFAWLVFIAGSNKTKFESYREKSLADDYAGDQVSRCPKTAEDALAVMQAHLDNHQKDVKSGANFNQVDLSKMKCFKCEKMGHFKQDCPENKESEDDKASSNKSIDL